MVAGALGTSITVGRWLGAEGLGSLAVINITIALGVQFGCFGIPSANTYFISQNNRDLPKVWHISLLFAGVFGSLIALAIAMGATWRPGAFGNVNPTLLAVAAISLPFQLITLIGLNVFLALGYISRFNVFDAASQLALLMSAIATLVVLGAGLNTLVSLNTVVAIIYGITVALLVQQLARQFGRSSSWLDITTFRRMVRYGIKFHIAVVAAIIVVRADVLLVNKFRGAGEAGVYVVAGQIANLLLLLPGVIATLLFPRVASAPDPQARLTMRVTRHTAFVMLLVCLGAVPFSFLLPWIYGAEFANSTLQFLILLPGVYLFGLESVLVQHFTGSGLPIAVPMFWVVVVVFNLVLNFLLIPGFGATAAAVVSSTTYALIFLLVAIYFRAKTGNNLSNALLMQGDELRQLLSPKRHSLFSE